MSSLPLCVNKTSLQTKLAQNSCRGHLYISANATSLFTSDIPDSFSKSSRNVSETAPVLRSGCAGGSVPDIFYNIGEALVKMFGECGTANVTQPEIRSRLEINRNATIVGKVLASEG